MRLTNCAVRQDRAVLWAAFRLISRGLVCCLFSLAASMGSVNHGRLAADEPLRVEVELPADFQETIDGRLFVFFSQQPGTEPMRGPNWFSPEPFYGIDVRQFAPGETRTIDDQCDGFPGPLSELQAGSWMVQAVLHHNFYFAAPSRGPGNLHSPAQRLELDQHSGVLRLTLSEVISEAETPQRDWIHYVQIDSPLLSEFHGRQVVQNAAVILPASYEHDTERQYPVLYEVSGFGGTVARMAARYQQAAPGPLTDDGFEMIRVLLDGQTMWGHHVYANSATNGPRGDALIHELIPHIDQTFRTVEGPHGRFVGGHSSGGWSSLWLQVNYPEVFGAVFSTAPDPVDFRDWQGIDLYAQPPPSLFFDESGDLRPLARRGRQPVVWYRDFSLMDDVLERGGQLRSFEAVFSPRGDDGEPVRLWDRRTGAVDPQVLEHWKLYDISLLIEQRWEELEPKLAGKIHIAMGELDTFYLEGATRLLAERLWQLGSDAEVLMIPNADHSNLLTPRLRSRHYQRMNEIFTEGQPGDHAHRPNSQPALHADQD